VKIYQSFLFLLLTVLFCQAGEAVCVHNLSEFQDHAAEMPPIVKSLPALLVGNNIKVTISETDGILNLSGYKKVMGHWFHDSGYLSMICSEAGGFKILLQNNKTYDVKVDGPTSVTIDGQNLVNSKDPRFAAIVSANEGLPASSANVDSSTHNSQ